MDDDNFHLHCLFHDQDRVLKGLSVLMPIEAPLLYLPEKNMPMVLELQDTMTQVELSIEKRTIC